MTNIAKISLVIADDHPILLAGIARVLQAEPDFDVLASCQGGAAALEAIRLHQPALAILDIVMPDLSGLQVLSILKAENSPTRVVFLTAHATDANIFSVIEGGASGLLLKDTSIGELMACIRQVAGGQRSFQRDMITAALDREVGRRARLEQFARTLSARERDILSHLARGLENKEIAHRLHLSEGTVRLHVHHIYQKTGIASRAALSAMALAYFEMMGR
jgi:two-component system nitrate/nitrite response regulator NarL